MDFTKFVSLLEYNALYFPNLTVLDDPLEGYLTSPTVKGILENIEKTNKPKEEKNKIVNHNLAVFKMARPLQYVLSWHLNEYESAAMWKLYLKSNEGVAIKSTVDRLIRCFAAAKDTVHIGLVKYIDFNKDKIPWTNMLYHILHKRTSFEHEKELRAMVMDGSKLEGKMIPVNLDILIERIYVAPTSPAWFSQLVKDVVTKYGLNKL